MHENSFDSSEESHLLSLSNIFSYFTTDKTNTSLYDDTSNNLLVFDNLSYMSLLNSSLHVTTETLIGEQAPLAFSSTTTILIALITSLMSLATIVGNTLVITAFIIDKNIRTYSNYFILNLSIADLLIGLLIPPYTPFLLLDRKWIFGRAACKAWLVLDYVVGSASVLCIVVISLDRYLLVSQGLGYVTKQKVSKAISIMATVWAIAFLNYAPAIVLWEYIAGRSSVSDNECQVEFHDNLAYLTATACVEFFAPLISITSLNVAVYLNIRKRSKGLIRTGHNKSKSEEMHKNSQKITAVKVPEEQKLPLNDCKMSPLKEISSNASVSSYNNHENANEISNKDSFRKNSRGSSRAIRNSGQLDPAQTMLHKIAHAEIKKKQDKASAHKLNKDRKAARSLFILVFVFVCCWAPYTFLTLIRAVCDSCVNDTVYEFTFWLLWLNSTVNPILYPFLHVKFRKAFAKIVCYLCWKIKEENQLNQMLTTTNMKRRDNVVTRHQDIDVKKTLVKKKKIAKEANGKQHV